MDIKKNVINQGVYCTINVHGSGLTVGKSYTACLYYSAKNSEYRATVTATAATVNNVATCVFSFTPTQTKSLKTGNVIFEVYDTDTLKQMKYDDTFGTVRATSLTLNN